MDNNLYLILILSISLTISLLFTFFTLKRQKATQAKLNNLTIQLSQTSQNQNQTYAKIAYERDTLSAEKNKLATIISSLPLAIIVLDLHKQVILANQTAEQITGFKESEMLKKEIDQIITIKNHVDQPISKDIYCPIDLTGSGSTPSYKSNQPLTLFGKNQKKTKVVLETNPSLGNIKADLGCILAIRDSAKDSSLESMQLDFVSMASHELRTPLTSIIGYANVLIDEGKDKFDQQQKDFLNKILTGAEQLSTLVSNLLNVSKVERGAISINTIPLDLVKVLTQAVDENKLQAIQKNISLELFDTNPSLPKVQADQVRIMEVLNNLIGNAISYTHQGGSIQVNAKLQGQEAIVSVKDTGKGIPPEAISHLFTKFFRVTNSQDVSSNSKGSGLGLYLSKSIIELHHGKIWAQSNLNQGTIFYFTLPVASLQSDESDEGDVLSKLGLSITGKGLSV